MALILFSYYKTSWMISLSRPIPANTVSRVISKWFASNAILIGSLLFKTLYWLFFTYGIKDQAPFRMEKKGPAFLYLPSLPTSHNKVPEISEFIEPASPSSCYVIPLGLCSCFSFSTGPFFHLMLNVQGTAQQFLQKLVHKPGLAQVSFCEIISAANQ